jgi:soluble lytic murein transglycosylase-like protein
VLALLGSLAAASGLAAVQTSLAGAWDPAIGPPYQRLIERVAERHELDAKLLAALVEVESARQARVVSHAGAVGLAQLMPETARRFGVEDPRDPADNLDGGARYLSWLLRRYEGSVPLALAAYNAGEGNVDRYGGIPPFRETQGFVRRVLRRAGMSTLLSGGGAPPARRGPPARVVVGQDGAITLTNVPGGG